MLAKKSFKSQKLIRNYSTPVYLVAGKRTAFGKFGGTLKDISPVDLSVTATKAALEASGVSSTDIDHVIFANVLPSTTDTFYASRHIALKSGAKIETPAYNVNRLCGSGIQALVDAKNMILRGDADVVLATGSENMSLAPHMTYGTRFGTRFEGFKVVDMLMDALTDAYCKTPMAITAESLAEKFSISRADCDLYSLNSHLKALEAYKNNLLQGEIVPYQLKKFTLEKDEHMRETVAINDMNKLPAVFKKDGVVTAATASGIVDGAVSIIVCSESYVKKHNLTPLAVLGQSTVVGVDPHIMGIGPVPAIRKLLEKTGRKLDEIDLLEINEAFAAQTLSCQKELDLNPEKLNIWGGAIALGHPLGASGLRITLTLARQLQALKKKHGIASACIGGGQGIAIEINSC